MTSAAIVALRARVASNTLTANDQGALTTALDFIAPTFMGPDETAAIAADEIEAREWIAALYTIAANGGSPVTFTRVTTPNTETSLTVPFQPTDVGKVLLVADLVPQTTGLLLVSVNLDVIEDAAGAPAIAAFLVDDLTAVTGGTLIAPGLTEEPTSTTPAFGGPPIFSTEQASFAAGNPHQASLTLASCPVQAVVGHRIGIVIVASDTAAQNWTGIAVSMAVVEI
jgi:hypothetical protein